MEQLRMKMYKAGKKWIFSFLGVIIMSSLGTFKGDDSVIGYQNVKADIYRNDEIKSASKNILDDTEIIPNIKIIDKNNPLGISAIFSVFSKSASLGADVNGNIATSQLKDPDRDFGTRSNNYNNTNNDISYVQHIDNNGVLNDRAFRSDNSVAIFGSSIQVQKNNVNQIEVNKKRVSTLTQDNTRQDKELNQYIDFDYYFNNLSNKSILYMNTNESTNVQKYFQDINNQLIDISNVEKNKPIIYVDIEFSKLNGPQDITIKGLSSKDNGSSVIFNVRNIPENAQLQTKINFIYDNGLEIKSNSEIHNMPNHVLWNFGNSNSTISINSGRILGSILAPRATINANVNVDGNIVGSTVNINGENHRWDLQTPSSETPSSETPSSETPSSETPSSETPSSETPSSETPSSETPKQNQQSDYQLPETDVDKGNSSETIALAALATLGISGIAISRRKK